MTANPSETTREETLEDLERLRGDVRRANERLLDRLTRAHNEGTDRDADGTLDAEFRSYWVDAAGYFERSSIPDDVLEEIDDTLFDIREYE